MALISLYKGDMNFYFASLISWLYLASSGVSGYDFWSFGNGNGNGSAHSQTLGTGTGMKNFIPNFWERERENSIPNFWEREWKFHSRISGTGMRRCYSRE